MRYTAAAAGKDELLRYVTYVLVPNLSTAPMLRQQ